MPPSGYHFIDNNNISPKNFQQNNVFETGLSEFHMIVVTELKMGFQKLKYHIVAYRDYKHFDNE